MPRILVLVDYYLPGWRAGGPIRSIGNMVEQLGDRYEFSLVTRDHDHTQLEPFPGIEPGQWLRVGKASVYYGRPEHLGGRSFARLIASREPELIFVNSLFSSLTRKVLMLRRLGRLPPIPILVAPRGEFGRGAMSSKQIRKWGYLKGIRGAGLLRGVSWQASSELEAQAISSALSVEPLVASDIPSRPLVKPRPPVSKRSGSVRLAFTARLAPIKNLAFLLRVLPELEGQIALDLYGPHEAGEWDRIRMILDEMPEWVGTTYHGPVPPAAIEAALADAHFSVLPTLGENFAHSIYEALRLGRPVVISDQTPWSGLTEAGAGWDLPLAPDRWRVVLQECVDMDDASYLGMSRAAFDHAYRWFELADPAAQQAAAFDRILRGDA